MRCRYRPSIARSAAIRTSLFPQLQAAKLPHGHCYPSLPRPSNWGCGLTALKSGLCRPLGNTCMYNGDFLVKYEDLTCVLEVVSRSGFLLFICRYVFVRRCDQSYIHQGRIPPYPRLSKPGGKLRLAGGSLSEKGNYLSSPPA
jgi:hypothetical protein